MDLYFAPLACSMASRITFYEADAQANFIEVDTKAQRTRAGDDYRAINPLGLVPALRTDDGEVLLENQAILQYIADRFPAAALAPASGMARSRLQQWLCFIGTELHKGLFIPLFDKALPEEVAARILASGDKRFAYLDACLDGHTFLLDTFSVADAYLFTVLNWHAATPIDLGRWPAVKAYYDRLAQYPSISRALGEERALYAEGQRRRGMSRITDAGAATQ